jgi:tetratricopeptide (TPR) repeat protein
MKKVVFATLLAVTPCVLLAATPAHAFAPQQSNIQLDPAEYNAYTAAGAVADPTARAAAFESFVTTYPNSKVKKEVLESLVTAYQQAQQPQKSIDAANRLLAIDPYSLRALVTIAGLDRYLAVQKNPPDQALLDQASDAATKGLKAPKPSDMTPTEFQKEEADFKPIFEDAKGVDEQNKKDYADAIKDLTQALADTPPAQVNSGNGLQDQFLLAQCYVAMTPPDTLKGAYYFARVSALAPQAAAILKNAQYYYRKYHGKDDGFADFQAMAKDNLMPPADLATKVTPAPSPTDIANQTVASTPDLTTLALSDREFILQYASQDNQDKVWATMKGKTQEIPGIVIAATADNVQLAVSDDAQQSKTADITIKMAEPLKTVPTVGSSQSYIATYDSYSKPTGNTPFMIMMVDGKSTAKPAAPKRPVARHR